MADNSSISRKILGILAGFAVLMAFTPPVLSDTTVKVANLPADRALHLRESPDAGSRVIAYIRVNSPEPLSLAGPCDEKWCQLSFRGLTGWGFRKYLDIQGAAGLPPADNAIAEAEGATGGTQQTAAVALPIPPAAVNDAGIERTAAFSGGPDLSIVGLFAGASLHLRDAPADGAAIVAAVPVAVTGVEDLGACEGKWCHVRYGSQTGWALRRHLARPQPGTGRMRVTGLALSQRLEVKDRPGDEGESAGALPSHAGNILPVGECDKNWCHVQYLGVVGWVKSRFLEPERNPKN